MEPIVVTGEARTATGKGACRKIRQTGIIPAVIYGHGITEAISVTLEERALAKALENPKGHNALFSFQVSGGDTHTVLVRELQRHPVTRRILHVDLVAPDLEKEIVSDVPVNLTGRSVGVSMGGRLTKPYRDVKLMAVPSKIPVAVTLDITNLDLGDNIMASELELPEGVKAVFDNDYVVVKVNAPKGRKGEEEVEEEAGSEEE